jgi:hypothetical protein
MKEQLDRIEAKLDRVIKAMQEYDGLDEDFNVPEDEYAWRGINFKEKEEIILPEPTLPKPKKKYYHNKKKKNGNS